MYDLPTIKKINATAHPFNREAAEALIHPDDRERIGVAHAIAQREAKDAIKALESGV